MLISVLFALFQTYNPDPYGPMVDVVSGDWCPTVERGTDVWDPGNWGPFNMLEMHAGSLERCAKQRQALIERQRRMRRTQKKQAAHLKR